MNIINFVNCWENEISNLVLKANNSKNIDLHYELTKLLMYVWRITPKVNFLNKKKLYDSFMVQNSDVSYFYKNICNELCGIKKNWNKSNIQQYIDKLIGFEK